METINPIRAYRLRQKPKPLSQQALGEQVGVSKASISRWECGRRTPRDKDHILRLSEITGIPLAELLGFETGVGK